MKIDPNKTYSIEELQYIFSKDLYKTAINYNKLNINQSVNSIAESNLNSNFRQVFDNVNKKINIFDKLIKELHKVHNNPSIKKHIDYLLYLKNILETKQKNDIKIINLFNAVMNNTNEISEKIKKIIRFNNQKKNINTLRDIRKLFNSIKDLTEIKNKDNKGGGIKNRSVRKNYKKIISQNKLKIYNLSLKKNLKELINNLKLIENNNKGGTNNKQKDISNYNDLLKELKELKNNNGKNNYTTELKKIKMKYEDGLKDNIAHFNSICKALKEYLTTLFNSTKDLLKNFINDGNEFMKGKNTIFNDYKDSIDKIIKDFLIKEITNRQKKIDNLQNDIKSSEITNTNISINQTNNTTIQYQISKLNMELKEINEEIRVLETIFQYNIAKLKEFYDEFNTAENINNNTYNNTINKLKKEFIKFRNNNEINNLSNSQIYNYIDDLSEKLKTEYVSDIKKLNTQRDIILGNIKSLEQQIINSNIQQKNQQNKKKENEEYIDALNKIYPIIEEERNKLQQIREVNLMFANSEYIEKIHKKNDKYLEILNNSNSNNLNVDIYLYLYELNNEFINFDDTFKIELSNELNKNSDKFLGYFQELYELYGITLNKPINLDTNEYFE